MLSVDDITKRFGDVLALDGVGFTVPRGGIVGFLGPNGAGKSTTMRAIMGLIAIDDGGLVWDGRTITPEVRRRFGYMPAERGMYPKMTVADQLVYFARLAGLSTTRAASAAAEWMERLDIAHRRSDEVQALSSGNQQRVQLAIALVHDPDLLILDEPFSGLDPVAVETMKEILVDQTRGGTSILFSSHQLDLVADITRDVVIVDQGRVVLRGDVRDIRERSEFRYASVAFGDDVAWTPRSDRVEVVHRDARSVRLRVGADVDPSAVLADAASSGRVVEFSFAPPDLSEVFLASIGRHATAEVAG
jgi:ABC-2 type transport system ATP-binding protein